MDSVVYEVYSSLIVMNLMVVDEVISMHVISWSDLTKTYTRSYYMG